jgi:hypothetical protein
MQVSGYGLRRTPLLRRWVNRRGYLVVADPEVRLLIRLLDNLEGEPGHDPERLLVAHGLSTATALSTSDNPIRVTLLSLRYTPGQ